MSYLPFQNTTVGAEQSMLSIQKELQKAGFEQTAILIGDFSAVVACYKSAKFRFEIDMDIVREKVVESLSNLKKREIRQETEKGQKILAEVTEQAARIGWRLLAEQIKGTADAIKYGVLSPIEAFAGYLLLPEGDRLSSHLVSAIENGRLISPKILMLEK